MTVALQWDLQQAVFDRLSSALATAGTDGAAVPVYDHARPGAPVLFVRIDGFGVSSDDTKNSDHGMHRFTAHVFHKPEDDAAHAVGQKETKRLQGLIYHALHRWTPIAGGKAIYHEFSSVDPDEDGLTRHGLSRFKIQMEEQ